MTSDIKMQEEIDSLGLTKEPRLTIQEIESVILTEEYFLNSSKTMTICLLTLKNGFTVSGENAAVSAGNYSLELGRKYSREKAVDKVWELEGYLLKEKLYQKSLSC